MDDPVSPFFGAPFVIRTGLVSRFTTLAVDPQVRTTAGDAFDVVFVGMRKKNQMTRYLCCNFYDGDFSSLQGLPTAG